MKTPATDKEWSVNMDRAAVLLLEHRRWLFASYVDPDALGSMAAMAVYLKMLGKQVYIVLPHSLDSNLDFMEEIIHYHEEIRFIKNEQELLNVQGNVDAVMFFDTANPQLLPFGATIQNSFIAKGLPVIETDHHFGSDSQPLAPKSVQLYRRANANVEIVGELFEILQQHGAQPDPFEKRSILLSLLTGLLCDTGGGQIIPNREDYDYWMAKCQKNLKNLTRWRKGTPDRLGDDHEKKFAAPDHLLQYINKLSSDQEACIQKLLDRVEYNGDVAFLNLLDPTHSRYQVCIQPYESGWFSQVRGRLINEAPERSGKIGVVCFNGISPEGEECIFIKIRRAVKYDRFDLRKMEDPLRAWFDGRYLGGGGHPGAVSFRVTPTEEKQFVADLGKALESVQHQLD